MSATKIVIDPTSRILYASFYIQGLYNVFGKDNVSFSNKSFDDLDRTAEDFTFEHYFAFVIIKSEESPKKVVIDFCDPPDINETAYKWCDFYAKINFNSGETDKRFLEKIIVIPPAFGIRIWNAAETLYYCFYNALKCGFLPLVGFKRFVKDYYLQYKRPKLSDYQYDTTIMSSSQSQPYVFMIATLWEDDENVNIERKRFIELTRAKGCNFEGGFFATQAHPKFNEYKDYIFEKLYSSAIYLEKSKQSYFVFNTPAVHCCHGWKLAEYLAMGKAIISTPLFNELPHALKHGENIHYISTIKELGDAISSLKDDYKYQHRLGQNAQNYYEKYVKPKSVIQNLLISMQKD